MPYRDLMIDPSKIPEGYERNHMIYIAQQHNALAASTGQALLGLQDVIGKTPEEQKEMKGFYGKVKSTIHILYSKRFTFGLGLVFTYVFLGILKMVGLQPEQAHRLVEVLIKILERFASQ